MWKDTNRSGGYKLLSDALQYVGNSRLNRISNIRVFRFKINQDEIIHVRIVEGRYVKLRLRIRPEA
jgi:hypothetical protein